MEHLEIVSENYGIFSYNVHYLPGIKPEGRLVYQLIYSDCDNEDSQRNSIK